jgi:glycosyltransferase involved in cell wall biosynthesis
MASGVPVVSTRVGMGPDLIVDGITGGLVDGDNGEEIAWKAGILLNLPSSELARLKQRAQKAVKIADWAEVGRSHWEKVYQPLLHK